MADLSIMPTIIIFRISFSYCHSGGSAHGSSSSPRPVSPLERDTLLSTVFATCYFPSSPRVVHREANLSRETIRRESGKRSCVATLIHLASHRAKGLAAAHTQSAARPPLESSIPPLFSQV